ncbi:MAG: acyltransferase family protein, partial [Terracidiphilus sp.]
MAENAGKIAPFRSLDVLRGLAALWVVMCHAADHYVGGTRWEKWPVYSFSLRGQLGVVLFFLISGYCIIGAAYSAFASGKRVRRFAFERARRIYPPYFFTIVLALLVGGTLILAQHHHLILAIHHPMQLSGGARFWVSNLFIIQSEAGQGYI